MDKKLWEKINNIPDKELWYAHNNLKNKFFNFIKERVSSNWTREGEDPTILDRFLINLNPSPLTIGFARRFATYKRATMFLSDFERMKRNLLNKKFPLQMVFAGKAHPEDVEGARLIKEIVKLSKQEEFLGKIIFLEDYNIAMARKMVAGVDVWLNNPVRPMEASGTSGMKAGINGVPNCSILDGWWEEGYNSNNGWAIGDRKQYKNPETQNQSDTDSFYDILENEIIPTYYSRNSSGIPEKWLKILRSSIISVITEYNTHRMLKDYVNDMYVPAARRYNMMSENNFGKANEISQWINNIRSRFSTIHIHNVIVRGSHGDIMNVNDEMEVIIELDKGKLTNDEIRVQMVVIHDTSEDSIDYSERPEYYDESLEYIGLNFKEENDNILTYNCKYKALESGKFNYGIRVLPHHPMLSDSCDMNLIYWA
jgi:phosphorylase/glycogen(starch) synthase